MYIFKNNFKVNISNKSRNCQPLKSPHPVHPPHLQLPAGPLFQPSAFVLLFLFLFFPLLFPFLDLACGGDLRTVKLEAAAHPSSCDQGLLQGAVHTRRAPLCCWTLDSEPSEDRQFI